MGKRSREKVELSQDGVKSDDQAASLLLAKKNTVDPSLALLFASSVSAKASSQMFNTNLSNQLIGWSRKTTP